MVVTWNYKIQHFADGAWQDEAYLNDEKRALDDAATLKSVLGGEWRVVAIDGNAASERGAHNV